MHIRWVKRGTGNAYIFIHGFLESGKVWYPWIDQLKISGGFLIPDLPGHGLSKIWENGNSFREWGRHMIKVLDQGIPGEPPINIVGHSMGGYLAFEIATMFPGRIGKIVLFHSTPLPDTEKQVIRRNKQIELIQKGRSMLLTKSVGPDMFAPSNRQRFKQKGQEINQIARSCTGESMVHTLEAIMGRGHYFDIMYQKATDILLITGDSDPFMPVEYVRSITKTFPGLNHHQLSDCGHAGFLEKPDESRNLIEKFFNQV